MTESFMMSLYQLRVIGSLIEKEITTPDQYPLSLNALTNACNQKSNREPVLDLNETQVRETLDTLIELRMVTEVSSNQSRVVKFKHRFCNTEFSSLQFSPEELAVLCVLFLRGAQTPGELRTRTNRLCAFANIQQTEDVLENLSTRSDGPFVARLEKEPGKREARYSHLFGDDSTSSMAETAETEVSTHSSGMPDRLELLEDKVEKMQDEIDNLKAIIDELLS